MTLRRHDVRTACGLLALLGVLTHFTALAYPREVVFDEATMGNFVSAYCCTGERIFDLHPPHGKLLIAAGARLGGYDGTFTFGQIGKPYGDVPVFALRFVPALSGVMIAPLFLLLLIELGASFPIAALGGLMAALDNALVLETRIIVWDGLLVASILASLVCFLKAEQREWGVKRWLVASGACAGLAAGCKLTGLAALGVIGVCLLYGFGAVRGPLSRRVRHGLIILGVATVVYAAGWVAHALILQRPGPADGFYASTGGVVHDILAAHAAMLRENARLTASHPDASAPWTWPLMKVAPYFWQGTQSSIYLVGNPVIWWGSSLLFIVALAAAQRGGNAGPRHWIPLAGYVLSFLPLMPIPRVLFLYHYLTPLLFGLAFGLLWLDRQGWIRPGGLAEQPRSYFTLIAIVAAGFLLVSPLTYGFSAGGYDEWLTGIVRSWR
jgi:dolichyl-phosphate-mannose--protein O-mannosyl transferase